VSRDKPKNGKWDAASEGKFRMAAFMTKEYFDDRKHRINSWCKNTPEEQCRWLFEAVKVFAGDDYDGVTPGWFCTEYNFNTRLSPYLTKQNILIEEDEVTYNPMPWKHTYLPSEEFDEERHGCQV